MPSYYDNTRLTDFKTCPRYYYFRHERDWVLDTPKVPLIFGLAWHSAMDVVWKLLCTEETQNLRSQEVAEQAFEAFKSIWIENGMPEEPPLEDYGFKMRNLGTALEMLYEYVEARRDLLIRPDFRLIAIEQPFAVPLSDNPNETAFYVGRFDKVFALDGRIYIGEHKTTSLYKREGGFRSNFLDSFSPNSQIDGYLYAAHLLYGDDLKAVWVDAALVHTSVHDAFTFIPVERQFEQLDAWLWEARTWIGQVEGCKGAMHAEQPGPYLVSWPKNTNNCINYGSTCPYMDLCKMWPNPETQRDTPPGYRSEHWSPFDVLGLEKLGLEHD